MSSLQAPHPQASDAEPAISTHAAARMLGVSVGTVLNMVDRGQLRAWRTAGGHRRIARSAVTDHLSARMRGQAARLRVMVVEDADFFRVAYADQFEAWSLPVDLRLCDSGVEAMLEIGRQPPDILFADLRMPEIDGFAVVRTLRADERFAAIDVVVITGLSDAEIAAGGGLPSGVPVWHKPIPFAQMRGYLDARLSDGARAIAT